MRTVDGRIRAGRLGAIAFLAGSVLVHVGNYAFNLLAVRHLEPAEYADVALAVTLLLLSGFVTVGFQMSTARVVTAEAEEGRDPEAAARWFRTRAFRLGAGLGLVVVLLAPHLAATYRTTSVSPFIAVGVAMPFAFSTGVGRGLAQGLERFGRLAVSFQIEMIVRLGLGAGLIVAGLGVVGGVTGLALSVVAASIAVRTKSGYSAQPDRSAQRRLLATLWPSLALLVGEALTNHADTVIVKYAFDPVAAGQFAAVALLGRSVFFVTWPISMLAFPIATRRTAAGQPTTTVLVAAAGVVAAVGAVATAIVAVDPAGLVRVVLGPEYVEQSHLLVPYVLATALFATATTILSLRLATGRDAAGYGAGLAGVGVVGGLSLFHPSLEAVVWTQVILMAVYLGTVLWSGGRTGRTT